MELTLYMRSACHLCEDMQRDLVPWQERLGFSLQTVDVDSDPELVARFNTMVPVLMAGDQEICHYFLDEKALLGHFSHG